MRVRRRAAFHVDASERVGEQLRVDGRLARTNIQTYDTGDGQRREYRPPEEVFSDSALSSLRSIPVTIHHPAGGMVRADNWRQLAVGHVADDVRRDDDGHHVRGSVWVSDADAQRRVSDRELTELSVGYWAQIDETPGTAPNGERYDAIQRGIEGNHLALLEPGRARGGPTVRLMLDSDGHAVMDPDPAEPRQDGKEDNMKFTLKVDGVDYIVEAESEAVAQAIAKERSELTARADAGERARDELQAKLDTANEKIKKLEGDLATATDPKTLQALASELTHVRGDATLVAGRDITCDGDALAIRRAALEARGDNLDGKSDDYITARFDTLVEAAKETGHRQQHAAARATPPRADDQRQQGPAAGPGAANTVPGVDLDRGLSLEG